jgi:NADP-dependent 3-hydroxy acid dehydrogenase YdfG
VARRKLAIVTGATSGIGAQVGRVLAGSGLRVLLVGRDPRKLALAARRLPPRSRAGIARADLRSVADIRQLLRDVARGFSHVDVLVHCAGEYRRSELRRLDGADFDLMFEVNVRAPYLLTKGLVPLLRRAGGQVIFLNSSVVRNPGEGVAAYKATQHALQGFTDSLRQELNRGGIRVTSLFPGRTATPRMRRIYAHEGRAYRPALLLNPREVAEVVLALVTLPRRVEITEVNLRSVTPY